MIQHRDEAGAPVALRLRVNGKTASEWLASNDWSWYAFPENLDTETHPYELAPGSWAVFTFNGATADWGVNREIRLEVADAHTGHRESVSLTLKEYPLRLRSIVYLAENVEDILPENMAIHVTNDRNEPFTPREVDAANEREAHLDILKRCGNIARALDCTLIRGFTFWGHGGNEKPWPHITASKVSLAWLRAARAALP